MTDTITFTKHPDGSVTADGFPDRIMVAADLLDQAARQPGRWPFKRDGHDLTITVANGSATYKLRSRVDDPRTFDAVRRPPSSKRRLPANKKREPGNK